MLKAFRILYPLSSGTLSFEKELSDADKKIPELKGYSMRKAISILNAKGIHYEIDGSGTVVTQNPSPGSLVNEKTICMIGLK